jgi:UPF0716 protein FxsA
MKSKRLGLAGVLWLSAEILAFYLVAHAIGLFAAILLGVATTFLGLSDVKRLLTFWRTREGGGATLDGALQALGSLLLIVPGFASDFAGLALKSPSVRAAIARRLRERGRDGAGGVVDLAPNEWHRVSRGRPIPGGRKTERRSLRSTPCP